MVSRCFSFLLTKDCRILCLFPFVKVMMIIKTPQFYLLCTRHFHIFTLIFKAAFRIGIVIVIFLQNGRAEAREWVEPGFSPKSSSSHHTLQSFPLNSWGSFPTVLTINRIQSPQQGPLPLHCFPLTSTPAPCFKGCSTHQYRLTNRR